MQIGDSNYTPKNASYFMYKPKEQLEEIYKTARIVICHAGMGSILSAVKHKRKMIIVPRRRKYGELLDDHQVEIGGKLEMKGINVVWDIKELKNVIEQIDEKNINFGNERSKLINSLKGYISS